MAGLIAQGFIDDLLNRTDIVEVVGSRVQLKSPVRTTPPAALSIKRKHPLFLSVRKNSFITVSAVVPAAMPRLPDGSRQP